MSDQSTLAQEAMAVRLAALGREAWLERGRKIVAGRQRYSPDQIARDTEQATLLHRAASRLERMAREGRE